MYAAPGLVLVLVVFHGLSALPFLTDASSGQAAGWHSIPLDQVWVQLVYARNLAHSYGLFFNPGQPSAAVDSPLWALLLAVAETGLGGLGLPTLAKALGLVLAVGVSVLTFRVLLGLLGSRPWAMAGAVLIAVDPTFAFAKVSGSEVPLFALLVLASCWSFRQRRLLWSGLFSTLAVLCRPEGLLVVGLMAVTLLAEHWWEREDLNPVRVTDLRDFGSLLGPPLVLLVGWTAYSVWAAGQGLPAALYPASRPAGILETFLVSWNGYWRQVTYFKGASLFLAGPIIGLGMVWTLRRGSFAALPLVVFPWAATGVAAYGLRLGAEPWPLVGRRLLDPAIPLVVILLLAGCHAVWLGARRALSGRPGLGERPLLAGRALVIAGLTAGCLYSLLVLWLRLPGEYSWSTRTVDEVNVAAGRWLKENTSPEATVGALEPGAVRFFGERQTYDLTGANSPRAPGQDPFRIAASLQVDYLVAYRNLYFDSWPHGQLVKSFVVPRTTILTAPELGIYRTDWQPVLRDKGETYHFLRQDFKLLDELDVGNVPAELSHGYRLAGDKGYIVRTFRTAPEVVLEDDARLYTGAETMNVRSEAGRPLVVVKRYDAGVRGAFQVIANGQVVGIWELKPHQFFFGEDSFTIPGEHIAGQSTQVRLDLLSTIGGGDMNSFYYWFFTPK